MCINPGETGEVANIRGRDGHVVSEHPDGGGLPGQDGVGVQIFIRGRRATADSEKGPELSGPVECGYAQGEAPEAGPQDVEPTKLGRGPEPKQLPANFEVGNGGYDEIHGGELKMNQPVAATINLGHSLSAGSQPERPSIEQDELGHSAHPLE